MTTKTTKVCNYFERGFCKFGERCSLQHKNKTTCEKIYCKNKLECEFRHPKQCKYFEKFGQCKFGIFCAYLHQKPAWEVRVENMEMELQNLKSKIKNLNDQIKSLPCQPIDSSSSPSYPLPIPPPLIPPPCLTPLVIPPTTTPGPFHGWSSFDSDSSEPPSPHIVPYKDRRLKDRSVSPQSWAIIHEEAVAFGEGKVGSGGGGTPSPFGKVKKKKKKKRNLL